MHTRKSCLLKIYCVHRKLFIVAVAVGSQLYTGSESLKLTHRALSYGILASIIIDLVLRLDLCPFYVTIFARSVRSYYGIFRMGGFLKGGNIAKLWNSFLHHYRSRNYGATSISTRRQSFS